MYTDGDRTLKTQAVSLSNLVANPNRKIKENGISLNIYETFECDHAVIVLKRIFVI